MTYLAQWNLTYDDDFVSRGRAACTQQANTYKDDQRPDWKALAGDVLRGNANVLVAFQGLLGAAPGFADEATGEDGSIDSSLIVDAEILSAVQASWPTVADLFYDADGQPIATTESEET
jgi:hypothetical protein